MEELKTEITIQASAQEIWTILTDFPKYSAWNPFIPKITGIPKVGNQLTIQITPPGSRSMTFNPTVTQSQQNKIFQWSGHLLVPGIFDGIHTFTLQPITSERTRLIHKEIFTGLLVPLLWKSLNTNTRQGFEQMNQHLKQESERLSSHISA
ncbi:MAG: SRPBCC family protein [Phormidesmis sp.]